MSEASKQEQPGGFLASVLASLQQGVIGINNLTQTMKTIFPSSS